MSYQELILYLAAAAAGAINSIAGGGTLLTFPTLFSVLKDFPDAAVLANGTSTVALLPGSVTALFGYRREIRQEWRWGMTLFWPSLVGGIFGSWLVVQFPDWFAAAVPWLILTAAVLFTLQPKISKWRGREYCDLATAKPAVLVEAIVLQFLIAIYGGYFGAGIGILMLSTLGLLGLSDIHRMNAVKTLLACAINGTSVVVFSASRSVHWEYALVMAVFASIGGYVGAVSARRVPRSVVRALVVTIGFTLAAYYFYRQFRGE